MPRIDLEDVFRDSAAEVLETMFFTSVSQPMEMSISEPGIETRMQFKGDSDGEFGLQISVKTARAMARSFLASDEISDQQVGDVVCELGNMLCGAVLSRIDRNGQYRLLSPELHCRLRNPVADDRAALRQHWLSTDEGNVSMWIRRA